jgi:uncharacterized protein YdiU (UPF0061 family)
MTESAIAAPPLRLAPSAFARLGPLFHRAGARAAAGPVLGGRSAALAREMGIDPDWLGSDDALQAFSGNACCPAAPLASVYSGHQFGVWAGQLGDGRACCWAKRPAGSRCSSRARPTPYSRMGDGRAVLRSSIREFLVSEAMQAWASHHARAVRGGLRPAGAPRDDGDRRRGDARGAQLHPLRPLRALRHSGQHAELKALADHVIDRFYPACRAAADPYAALLGQVTERTARLLAQWQAVGFMHGVMNTDNMSILGLTIDYGPFQFMDAFDPGHICNHSDSSGRYAFDQQPAVATGTCARWARPCCR